MPLVLTDEQGNYNVDARILTLLMKETFQMAVAYSVQHESGGSNKAIVRKTNVILKQTWGNDEWMKKYMDHIFTTARENQRPGEAPPEEGQP